MERSHPLSQGERLLTPLEGLRRIEEQGVEFQQLAEDGGAPGSEVGVADVRIILADIRHVAGILAWFPAEDGEVRVAEEGAVVVPLPGAVVRRQPHQPCHLGDLSLRQAR